MNISKKTQYGLRALARLAHEKKRCSLRFLAEQEGISAGYLEKIFSLLEKNGLVEATRGVNGGYILAMSSGQISVGRVVDILEEMAPVECLRGFKCPRLSSCRTINVWRRVESAVRSSLDSLYLNEII